MKKPILISLFICFIFQIANAQINTFPYVEDFENPSVYQPANASCDTINGAMFTGWTQDPLDDGDWRADTAGTTSVGTGPGATSTTSGVNIGTDVNPGTTGGVYLYTEGTSAVSCGNAEINLISPYFDLSSTTDYYEVTLDYHMFGAGMGSLHIDVEQNGTWTNSIWTRSGQQDSIWLEATASLANFNTDSIRIRIRAIMGSNFQTDLAIDDFKVDTFDAPFYDALILSSSYVPSEYPLIPITQFDSLTFEVVVKNEGLQGVTQTEVAVTEGSYTGVASIGDLASFETDTATTATKYFPASSGTKTFALKATIAETDVDTTNNTDTLSIVVTDTTMGREDGSVTGGIGFNAGNGEIGQMFELINGDTLTSITFYINTPTPGDSVKVNLYQFGSVPGSFLENSDTVHMVAGKNWYTVPLKCHQILSAGKYFVTVEQLTTGSNMSLGYTSAYFNDSTAFYGTPAAWTPVENANFFISLLVRLNFGSITIPTATITSNKDTVCPQELVLLSATLGESYSWTPSNEILNPSGQTTLGQFSASVNVTLTVDFGCNLLSSDSFYIFVKPGPTGTTANDTTVCSGSAVTLKAYPGAGESYQWVNGPSNADWNVSPANDTSYNVVFTTMNGCNTSKSITVSTQDGNVNVTNDTTVCQGESVTLTASGADTYQWAGGPSAASYTIAVDSTTTFYVIGTDILGCNGFDSVQVSTLVSPSLIPINDTGACFLRNISLTAGGTADHYNWSTGDTTASTTYQVFTPQTITLRASNDNGCEDFDTVFVDRYIPPSATIGNDTTICEGTTIFIAAYGGDSYVWNTNDSTQAIAVSPTQQTTYSVTVYTDEGCEDYEEITISVDPSPRAAFSVGVFMDSIATNNTSTDATNYYWSFGDGDSSTAVSPSHVYDSSGTYTIILTAQNDCDTDDSTFDVTITVPSTGSVRTINEMNSVIVYPVPSQSSVSFHMTNALFGQVEVKLLDVTGKELESMELLKNDKELIGSFELVPYSKGIYFIEFSLNGSKAVRKVIKD